MKRLLLIVYVCIMHVCALRAESPKLLLHTTLHGCKDWVSSVEFSPDNKMLASASGKTVKLWDIVAEKNNIVIERDIGVFASVAYSNDGKYLATGSLIRPDNQNSNVLSHKRSFLQLWDTTTGKNIANLHGHTEGITEVTFSPNGNILASGDLGGKVMFWRISDRKNVGKIIGPKNPLRLTFSPDGRQIACGNWLNGKIEILDIISSRHILSIKGSQQLVVSLAYFPDGKTLVSSGHEDPVNTIKFWDTTTSNSVSTIDDFAVGCIALSPSGRILAGGDLYGKIKLWDTSSNKLIAVLDGHSQSSDGAILCLAFSPNGKMLASGSVDKTIKIWDLIQERGAESGGEKREIKRK